jgi:hypothetical protein
LEEGRQKEKKRHVWTKKEEEEKKQKRWFDFKKDVVAIGILICFFLFVVSLYFKEPRGQKVFVKTKTEKNKKRLKTKVIAIGDVHGDEDVLRRLLFATGATDKVLGEDVKWVKERNERTVLVQTGDVVDRGKDSIGSFTFIRDIRAQVLVPGDEDDVDRRQIRLLVGNHELMAIQADYRFVAKEELVALGEAQMEKYGEQEKIHPDSTIGKKALQKGWFVEVEETFCAR